MIHYTTKNASALKMSHLFEEMGIENDSFFLELYDEELLNVDPWDENLDSRQKARICKEISINPYYFLREVCRIPEAGSVPFEFHRGNLAVIWSIINDISFFVLIPRQTYKTYTIAAVYYWLMYWGTMKSMGMLFGNSEDLVKNNLERVKKIRDELPPFLRLHEGKDNQHELEYSVLENLLKVKAPGKSKEEAMKVGRGFSTAMQWWDEFAFIPFVQHQYESALYAYGTISQVAKKNGLPYHKAISTTAASLSGKDAKWAHRFLNNCADFTEKLYDMPMNDVKDYISASSTNGILRIEFMYYDLSKDEDYFPRMVKESDNNWDAINREVLNMWLDASVEHPLGQDTVVFLNNKVKSPKKTIVVDDVYLLKIYRDLDKLDWDRILAAGVDCGGNVMRDFSTLVIVDPTNMEVIATLRSNSYSTTRFSKAIYIIMKHIFPNLKILPERNSMGIAIIDTIITFDPSMRNRIYHDESGKPGIHNNHEIRTQLFNDILKVAVKEDADRIHDRNIIQEIGGLIVTRNGRIDHQSGEHDDTLMAYLLARWFLTFAKNRKRYIPLEMIQSRTEATDYTDTGLEKMMSNNWMKGFFGTGGNQRPVVRDDQGGVEMVRRPSLSRNADQIFSEIAGRNQSKVSGTMDTLDSAISEDENYERDPEDLAAEIRSKKTTFVVNQQEKSPETSADIAAWTARELRRI